MFRIRRASPFPSYPIERSFARLGVSIGYDDSSIRTVSTGRHTYFTYLNFLRANGPNALNGIKTISITPSYSYNSKNNFLNPTAGKSIFFSVKASASVLGANVNVMQPTFDVQYYHVSPKWHRNVLAFHLLGHDRRRLWRKVRAAVHAQLHRRRKRRPRIRVLTASRRSPICPAALRLPELNPDGSQRTQKQLVNGVLTSVPVALPVPAYQIISPGGDTHAIFNFEYRIPIVGPITMAPFFDAGINRIL